ncbi:hypothetical protein B0H10DRAFT_2191133 [Mycena sp. CBHHK59/15]|nr:hypothetical protein B0H10DRAFT_2191133 [Mycena sp. CBHHK59/15]
MIQLSLYNLRPSRCCSEVTEKWMRGENNKSKISFGAISQNDDEMFQSLSSTDFLALVIRRTSPLLRFFFRCGRRGFAVPTRSNKAPSLVTIPETFSSQVPCADPWIQTSIFGLPANHLMNMHKIRPRAPIKHSHGITPHPFAQYMLLKPESNQYVFLPVCAHKIRFSLIQFPVHNLRS